jgi:hypothetical protein
MIGLKKRSKDGFRWFIDPDGWRVEFWEPAILSEE